VWPPRCSPRAPVPHDPGPPPHETPGLTRPAHFRSWLAAHHETEEDRARWEEQGKRTAAGHRALAARTRERTGVYCHERNTAAQLSAEQERELRANSKAAAFFTAQPPWYRRTARHWLINAKREERPIRSFRNVESTACIRTTPTDRKRCANPISRGPRAVRVRASTPPRAEVGRRSRGARTGACSARADARVAPASP